MAYKFQRGEANLSGAIELQSATAELSLSQQDGSKTVEITQAGIVSASAQVRGLKLTIDASDVITSARAVQNITSIAMGGGLSGATTVSGSSLAQFGQVRSDGGLTMQGNDIINAARALANVTSVTSTGVVSSSNDGRFLALDVNGAERISSAGNVTAVGLSGSAALQVGGTVRLDGVAQAAVDVAGDFIVFVDDSDQLLKKEAVGDFAADLAGTGLEQNANTIRIAAAAAGEGLAGGAGSALSVDLNELSTSGITVAQDLIPFISASGDNESEKISVANFVSAIAGGGLSATNGVLSTDAGSVTEVTFATTTLSEGYNFYTGSANKALALPTSPSVGDVVYVKVEELGAGNAVTINRAGSQLIDGETSVLLESLYSAVGFVYLASNKWGII